MALNRELETYEQNVGAWLDAGREGLWALIHGDDVLGLYDSLDAAAAAGYERFGLSELFMVRQVCEQHIPIHASRRAVNAHRAQAD